MLTVCKSIKSFQFYPQDQEVLKQTKPMHMSGLYVSPKHIQKYIEDFVTYGFDYQGEDVTNIDDIDFEPIPKYWDESDGKLQ